MNEVIKPNVRKRIAIKVGVQTSLAVILIVLSLFSIWISVMGCASIKPGEDALVVRCEQAESTAKATFDLILNIDNSDRGFWRTNAPAFHAFCEWLRQPQVFQVTNALPRASAMIVSVNAVKRDYIASKSYSNALVSALSVLQSASDQAGAWSTIATNTPPQ